MSAKRDQETKKSVDKGKREGKQEQMIDENVGWFSRLTGKKAKDEIAPALREQAADWKREHGSETRGLCAPPRSRSVSVAMAEKKESRRKSLDSARPEMKAKDDFSSRNTRKEAERKPATEVEKAFAKAKEAEERAAAAKAEATRLIAEANKALAAAAAAKAEVFSFSFFLFSFFSPLEESTLSLGLLACSSKRRGRVLF